MLCRRSKTTALEARAWSDFRNANGSLLRACGIPASLYESREWFDNLLMHGSIDPHDLTRLFVEQPSETQRDALIESAARDLRAGFPDPGIGFFMGRVTEEELRRRADLADSP